MEIYPGYYSFVRKDNKLWFVNIFFNGLFSYDLSTDILHYEHCFRNVSREVYLNRQATSYGENLYFLPPWGNKILCYNITTKRESVIDIPIVPDDMQILSAKRWKNKLAVIFTDISYGLYIIDLETNVIEKHEKLSELLCKYKALSGFGEIIHINADTSMFQFVDWNIGKLVVVDLEKESILEIETPKVYMDTKFVARWGGERYAISPAVDGKKFCLWENGSVKVVEHCINDELVSNPDSNCIWQIFLRDEKIYILMKYGEVIEYDEKYGMKKCFEPSKVFVMRNSFGSHEGAFIRLEFVNDEMWCHPCCADRIVIYNLKTGRITTKQMSMNSREIPDFDMRMKGKVKRRISEEGDKRGYYLEEFCYAAGKRDNRNHNTCVNVGEMIMKRILLECE